jgi:succinate dehydrogenase / fumarate reductase cytochrome b subunit
MARGAISPSLRKPVMAGPQSATAARDAFIRSRLASALAIFPLGAWTVVHLYDNLSAFSGPRPWQAAVTEYPHPAAQAMTGIVVLLPLALHGAWGIGRLLTVRPNNVAYPFYGNLKFLLQRVTAVAVLLFLGAHLWLALLKPRFMEGHAEAFEDIAHQMHVHTPTLITYLLGTLGVAYHLANGAQTFCMGWGVVTSQKALRRLEAGVLVFFAVLLTMAWAAIYALWLAGGAVGAESVTLA